MTTQSIWQRWLHGRRQRKLQRLLSQRAAIRKSGISIFAVVENSCDTGLSMHGLQLWRVRLKIRLPDSMCIYALSYAFVPRSCRLPKGLSLKVWFIPGDLSQIIIDM